LDNDYGNEWQQVLQFEDNGLPQSAIKIVEEILEKAVSDKNNLQVIKALIYRNKYKKEIDRNDDKGILFDLHELIEKTNDVGEKAFICYPQRRICQRYYHHTMYVCARVCFSYAGNKDSSKATITSFKNYITFNYFHPSIYFFLTIFAIY
jgi:hypothetical protein